MIFKTAIIGPPWPYDRASKNVKLKGYASQEYSALSIEQLAGLPVGNLVSDYVFLWTCGPFLKEGIQLLEMWGFEYKTQMCWHKSTGLGVGYWFRGDHELVLVGKKTGSPSIRTGKRSIFAAPRMRHSQKPADIHKLIEEKFPSPYLELFGRTTREGWTVLGNEAPGHEGRDITESLAGALAE